jgi:thioredoxin 2
MSLPWVVEAGDADFDAVAGAASLPVLVDFWAPWCGPCRVVGPAVEGTAGALAGRLKVVKVDVDEAPAIASRYGVRSIPTLLLLSHGTVAGRVVGARTAADLQRWVEATLATESATGRSRE